MNGKVTQEVVTGKAWMMQVLQVVMKCLAEGALSLKLTQEATIEMNKRFKEKPTDEEYLNTPILFTLPNGISTGSISHIVDEWLEPEVLSYLEKQGEFVPFKIVQHFVGEIDKIKVEVI
nr:MAG TPA: hypothetical protein [Caudoviricetes sp.]